MTDPTVLEHIALFSWLFLSLYFHWALGKILLIKLLRSNSPLQESYLFSYFLGLLLHLTTALLFLSVGLSWFFATFLPVLSPALLHPISNFRLQIPFPAVTLNFVVWFTVILSLGLTLFQVQNGIETPWPNNYGDLTFHLGMISSFVFGENFPPEYHLFAGERLSYPFFINLWSALYWWIAPSWENLATLFLFQWCLLWIVIYHGVRGDQYTLLPWALLFGGGSFYVLGEPSGEIIARNFPWTPFLSTIWVTQRSALFGTAVGLLALRYFFGWCQTKGRDTREVGSIGLLLALSPLVHTHICAAIGLYITLVLTWQCITAQQQFLRALLAFLFGASPALLFLPWLIGKAGTVKFITGWVTAGSQGIVASAEMWFENCLPLFVVFLLFWVGARRAVNHYIFPLLVLFFLANFFQLSIWSWDQIKIFLGLYLIFLSIWAAQPLSKLGSLQIFLPILMFPSLYESISLFLGNKEGGTPMHQVYSPEDLKKAARIRAVTEPTDILVGAPRHNSLLTLTGRRLYYGYEGTLHSHGLDYQDRKGVMESLQRIRTCSERSEDGKPLFCPQYLLWDRQERQHWPNSAPVNFVREGALPPYLYLSPPLVSENLRR